MRCSILLLMPVRSLLSELPDVLSSDNVALPPPIVANGRMAEIAAQIRLQRRTVTSI